MPPLDDEGLYPVVARGVVIGPLDLGRPEPSYLVQVPGRKPLKADRFLHRVLTLMDGRHSFQAIAAEGSIDGRPPISRSALIRLVERELIPAGVVVMSTGREVSNPPPPDVPAPQGWLGPPTAVLQHLISVPAFLILAPFIVAAHAWLYHDLLTRSPDLGLSGLTPRDLVFLLAVTLAVIPVHELGHLAAFRRFCGNHGWLSLRVGSSFPGTVAVVTSAWQLPRFQRLVVDLGGAWFQLTVAAAAAVIYVAVRSPGIPLAVYLSEIGLLLALLPLPGRDGDWVLKDLAGWTGGPNRGLGHAGLKMVRAYRVLAGGFFAVAQTMLVVLGVALVNALRESSLGIIMIADAILLLALGWLELRLLSRIAVLLAGLWAKRRTHVATDAAAS